MAICWTNFSEKNLGELEIYALDRKQKLKRMYTIAEIGLVLFYPV